MSSYFTVESIKLAHKNEGLHFFSKSAMRSFKSRVLSGTWRFNDNVTLFVTSERAPREARRFTVRQFDHETKSVNKFSEFGQFATGSAAKNFAKRAQKVSQVSQDSLTIGTSVATQTTETTENK